MKNLLEIFSSLSTGKKITYAVLFIGSMIALIVLFAWANRPEYRVLFTNLSDADSAKVIERLQSDNIDYKVNGSGAISIAEQKVYETRLKLAGEGLTKGSGVGFEIFDKSGFGVTEFVQKVNFNRALQGELARTVGSLTEVETARIHLVIPQKRLFSEAADKARASVVLKLKGFVTLKPSQIQGIVSLVANSVAGLDAQNVTVIDSTGKLLTKVSNDDENFNMTSTQLEYQRVIEKGYEKRIQDMLSPVVGFGKVIARVNAEIDFTQVQKTLESYDPDSVVLRSEQKSSEKSTSAASGGVPGVVSNVPGRGGAANASAGQAGSETKNETYNYEISRTVSTIIEPSGIVKRISVAVLVDGAYKVERTEDGELTSTYAKRSAEELAKFTDLVENAVGIIEGRGDTVEVVNIPFESEIIPEVTVEKGLFEKYLGGTTVQIVLRYATIMILSLLILFFILRPLIKGLLKFEAPSQFAGALPAGVSEAELPTSLPPEALEALSKGEPLPEGMVLPPSVEMPKLSPIAAAKKDLKDVVTENPQAAANIVKVWLKGKGPDGD